MRGLDAAGIAERDSTGQVGEALGLGEHVRDALWRVDSAGIAASDAPGGLVVAGMGGSAIGGTLAAAAIGRQARRPILSSRSYALPGWVGEDHCVLLSSYSGDTEETLAAYDDAAARGARRVVCTTGGELAARARRDGLAVIPVPGGFQPRAAVGYSTVVALEVARLCGAAPDLRADVESAAVRLDAEARAWAPDAADSARPKALARALHGTLPVICGAEAAAAVAYRWKSQVNENAKRPAFASELPEAAHNEICGWAEDVAPGPALVLLRTGFEHPRNAARLDIAAGIVRDAGFPVEEVSVGGGSPLERLLALVLLGDLASLYLAVLHGADPVEIAAIDRLKAELSAR